MEPTSRRACFLAEDDGLASLASMEAEFSGNHQNSIKPSHYLWSNPVCYSRRRSGSFRNLSSLASDGSPKAIRFYEAKFEEPHHQPHFLETCFFCKKSIGDNKDIFMYRGDTPFCSEECRQEQIEMDESKERNWNLSSSMQALRKKEKNKSKSPSPTKAQDYPSCAGTVAAA